MGGQRSFTAESLSFLDRGVLADASGYNAGQRGRAFFLNKALDVFPVLEPLVLGGQVGPGPLHRPIQFRLLFRVQLAPFLDG